MRQSIPFSPRAGSSSETTGLSRRVLRHLIISHDLPVGSRILDVGCGGGGLVYFLHRLGFHATGLDEDRETIDDARRQLPALDLRHGSADELAASGQPAFDIAIVRRCSCYDGNLLAEQSLTATAELLACLRPGGVLAFLARTDENRFDEPPPHSAHCYARHLAAFAGHAQTTHLPDSYARPGTWTSLLSGRRPTGYLTATFEMTAEPRTRDDWLHAAETASASLRHTCCHSEQIAKAA